MRLLDSNIIIYATLPENEWLREWLETQPWAISQITRVEVLGYHLLTGDELRDLKEFLDASIVVSVADAIADRAIALRQRRKIGLADALIAATALEEGWDFVSRNVKDFQGIADLKLINPFERLPS